MKNLDDEILNEYIDGELDGRTKEEVNEALLNSEENLGRLHSLRIVHEQLRMLKEEETSADFTSKLMVRVRKNYKARKEDKYFVLSIFSFMLVICLGIIAYVFSAIVQHTGAGSASVNIINNYLNYFTNNLESINSFLTPKNVSIIGSIFSFGMIITAYIFIDNLRNTKKSLDRLHK